MSIKLLALYFVVGGSVVALVSFLGTQTKGLLAAFFATLPTISMITLCVIYFSGGVPAATSYFKGILLIIPAWILYVFVTMFLLPRIGLIPSLVVGVTIYIIGGMTIVRLVH